LPAIYAAAAANSSASLAALQEGAQTVCDFPMSFLVVMLVLGLCLPHRKHDIVEVPKETTWLKGEPCTLD
jgi:hypothetical protein